LNRGVGRMRLFLKDADAQQEAEETICYSYDSAGRMLSEADDTSSIQYAYSDAGQILQITQSSDLAPTVVFAYAYNDAGLCSSVAVSIDGVADYVDDYSYETETETETGQVRY